MDIELRTEPQKVNKQQKNETFQDVWVGCLFLYDDNKTLLMKTDSAYHGTNEVRAVEVETGDMWIVNDEDEIEGGLLKMLRVEPLSKKQKKVKFKNVPQGTKFTCSDDLDVFMKIENVYLNGTVLNACYLSDGMLFHVQPTLAGYVRTCEVS